jgi:hypothetical protein
MVRPLLSTLAAAALAAESSAGFAGFVAFGRNCGANTVIDVFVAVTNPSDRFLNVYGLECNGTFIQQPSLPGLPGLPGQPGKCWEPRTDGFSNRSTCTDSFLTAGTFSGGSYGGEYFAAPGTQGSPNFSDPFWQTQFPTTSCNRLPSGASWYTNVPTSVDNNAELMSTWAGSFARCDSVKLSGAANAPADSTAATYGIWIAHLVVAGNSRKIGVDFTWRGFASVKDGVTGQTSQAEYAFPNPPIPAPGACALLCIAALGSRRRRAA